MIINHFLSLICQIGIEHKIYIFLYKLKDLVRTEHTFFGFVCQPRELQPAFVSTNKLDSVECFPQAAIHYYLMLALERGVLKHVLHRYTDKHYFHPRVLVYSALILLPVFDDVFHRQCGFVSAVVQKHMGSLYLDTIGLFSPPRFQSSII